LFGVSEKCVKDEASHHDFDLCPLVPNSREVDDRDASSPYLFFVGDQSYRLIFVLNIGIAASKLVIKLELGSNGETASDENFRIADPVEGCRLATFDFAIEEYGLCVDGFSHFEGFMHEPKQSNC
jgi:hypothetical protein